MYCKPMPSVAARNINNSTNVIFPPTARYPRTRLQDSERGLWLVPKLPRIAVVLKKGSYKASLFALPGPYLHSALSPHSTKPICRKSTSNCCCFVTVFRQVTVTCVSTLGASFSSPLLSDSELLTLWTKTSFQTDQAPEVSKTPTNVAIFFMSCGRWNRGGRYLFNPILSLVICSYFFSICVFFDFEALRFYSIHIIYVYRY